MELRYIALRSFTVGATSYALGDVVDTTGMNSDTLSGLSALGWVGTTVGGTVGSITVSSTEPASPQVNDLWIDLT